MKLEELTEEEYFQTNLYEMSSFFDTNTGLPLGTKLWVRTETKVHPHVKYRIKLIHPQNGSAVFTIWGDTAQQVAGNWKLSGRDLKKIQELVRLTKQELQDHINGQTDSADLGRAFEKIKAHIESI